MAEICRRTTRLLAIIVPLAAIVLNASAASAQSPQLRSARSFAVLGATTVTNTNDVQQSIHKMAARKKNVATSSSITEHEETTGHHMGWKNLRIVW